MPSTGWCGEAVKRFGFAVLALAISPGMPRSAQPVTYPVARRDSVVDDYHGTKIADPYRSLERLDDPGTGAWLSAETRLTDSALADPPGRWLAYMQAPGGADIGATRVHDLATGRERTDVVRGTGSSVRRWSSFTSLLSPETVYHLDMASGTSTAFRKPRPRFDPGEYEARQVS